MCLWFCSGDSRFHSTIKLIAMGLAVVQQISRESTTQEHDSLPSVIVFSGRTEWIFQVTVSFNNWMKRRHATSVVCSYSSNKCRENSWFNQFLFPCECIWNLWRWLREDGSCVFRVPCSFKQPNETGCCGCSYRFNKCWENPWPKNAPPSVIVGLASLQHELVDG